MSRVSLAARVRPPAERILRVRCRMLQTPVVRFEHRGTGRAVTVAGVVHIAQASYYRQLGAILTRLEAAGALVCYEGTGLAADAEWSAVGQTERDAWTAAVAGRQEQARAACRYLGWVRQGEALAYAASWRNVDLTDAEFAQRAAGQALLDQQEGIEDTLGSRPGDQRDVLLGIGLALQVRLNSLDRYQLLLHAVSAANQGFMQMMVDERNDRALAGLPSDQDSVLIWGVFHLPGLAAGLQRAGYQRQASAWLNAGELPALRASARAIWGVYRAGRRGSAAAEVQDSGSAGSSGM